MRVGKNDVNRKVFSLKDFRGVDYASSPLEVKPYRATDMANLLLRDGQLQKRYGFKQLFKASENVKGMFSLSGMTFDGSRKNFVLQIDEDKDGNPKTIFRRYILGAVDGDPTTLITIDGHYPVANSICVDGEYYLFVPEYGIIKLDKDLGVSVLRAKDVYAPITTINIPLGAYTAEDEPIYDTGVLYPYASNESVNMLTFWHRDVVKVKKDLSPFKGGSGTNGAQYILHFLLGGRVSRGMGLDEDAPIAYIDGVAKGKFVWNSTNNCWENEYLGVVLYGIAKEDSNYPDRAETRSMLRLNPDTTTFESRISNAIEDSDGYVNIEIKYADSNIYREQGTTYDGLFSQDALKIINSTCMMAFGVSGANDRIFLGGAKETPNIVYFSENDINLKPNPTYFPADQFIVCGGAQSKISGFMQVTDGTLAIFKDVSAHEDVAVYYTGGFYESVGVGEEGNEYQRARFTVKAGDIRRTGISAKAVANLEGDNIFTCKEGVYGIQLAENVASGERYARERSRTINPKITQFDLQNARGIVYKDKYFLAVGEGEVYVADARYTFTMQGDQQNTFNYEWFRLTGLNVLEWFIYDDKLHFIDKDGYICEFTDGFADQYLVSSKDNELTAHREDELWVEGGKVTFNSDRLPLIKASSYAVDQTGQVWELELVDNDTALKIPEGITIADSADLDLWFCVPVTAYWQSAVMDLGAPMYLKNMWSLSMVASAKHGGKINLGYKTRMNSVSNIEVEGANDFAWGNPLDLFGGMQTSMLTGGAKSFGMYTFDVGGYVGINTYRRRLFDRNFAHIQLLFTSETTTDCAVAEMDIEYSIARKNIGVG